MQRQKIIQRASKTAYPKIYTNTYWGWGNYDEDSPYSSQEIIENRNRFIEENNIKRFWKPTSLFYENVQLILNKESSFALDHRETYLTFDGYVIILVSPYGNYDESLFAHGFVRTYNLYGNGAISYVLKIRKSFDKKTVLTPYIERYFGCSINELLIKNSFSYWLKVMQTEQDIIMRFCEWDKLRVMVRSDIEDDIYDYMVEYVSDGFWVSYETKKTAMEKPNLYEFKKYVSSRG